MAEERRALQERLDGLIEKTAAREEALGREGFALLPSTLQNQLSVLQNQAQPSDERPDVAALNAAEHNLRAYNAKLDDAFMLVRQLEGEARRTARRRAHERRRLFIRAAIVTVVGGAAVLYYRHGTAQIEDECRASEECKNGGLCSGAFSMEEMAFVCAAQGDDCRDSRWCQTDGRCSAASGKCVAKRDEDCAATERCRNDGQCKASADGVCVAEAVQDCRRIAACASHGRCTPVNGVCVAGSDADCRQSDLCKEAQACSEIDGKCVAVPDALPTASAAATAAPRR